MTRICTAMLAAGVLGHCGCVGLRPVGPMAGAFTQPAPKPPAGVRTEPAKDGAPTLPPAPPPPAPALLVSPGEVTDATADEMARKLEAELEADRKSMEAMPRYSEVSVVRK